MSFWKLKKKKNDIDWKAKHDEVQCEIERLQTSLELNSQSFTVFAHIYEALKDDLLRVRGERDALLAANEVLLDEKDHWNLLVEWMLGETCE